MDTTQPAPQSDIFTRLGIADADQATKEQIAQQLADITVERLIGKASEVLSETDMAYIEGLIDAGTPEKVEGALREKIPGFDQLLAGIAVEVENQLVADQAAVLQAAESQSAGQAA